MRAFAEKCAATLETLSSVIKLGEAYPIARTRTARANSPHRTVTNNDVSTRLETTSSVLNFTTPERCFP